MELMHEILEELKSPKTILMFSTIILFILIMSPLLIKLWEGPKADAFNKT